MTSVRFGLALLALLLPAQAFADAFSSTPPPPVPSGVSGQFYNWLGQWSIPSGAGSTGNVVGSGATVVGHAVCWNNTSATAAIDCGIIPLGTTGNGSGLTGLVFSQIGSTPTTLAGYGITNGATNGANANITSLTGLTTPLSVAQGGTGTTTPGLVAGTNVTITGSWPNQTVNSSGGGGGSLTLTDGSHTVTGTTQITVTGAVVGGSTPNGTLTISASASSFTPGTTTILGATAPCALVNSTSTTSACLAYGLTGNSTLVETTSGGLLTASILPLGTNAAKGAIEGDGQSITCVAGVCSGTAADRTSAISATILATDMGGQVNFNGSSLTVTIPAISSTVFAAGMTATICNYAASTLTIATTPTINGYTPSTIPATSGGIASCLALTSNGTSLDAIPTSGGGGSGSGTVNSGTVGQIAVYAGSGTAISGQTVASGVILKGQGAAVPVASAISDNGSVTSIAEGALTTPFGLTDGASIAVNAFLSNNFTVTLAGNRTLANPTNATAGQWLDFVITQDGTGSRTLAFGAGYLNSSGAAFTAPLNSAAGAVTEIACKVITAAPTLICYGPTTTVVTGSNCSSGASPAVCASASAGSVAVPTGTNPTLVVNTTAVTANSQILLNVDESLGTKLSVTCNTTLTTLVNPVVTARTAGTSFTVQMGAVITVNPACVSYLVVN